jgi:hypothetical protein
VVQANQQTIKLNGTHQLLVYDDDINICGGIHNVKKNTDSLLVPNKEFGLEINGEKTTYMLISHEYNAGQNHNIKGDNKSFERVQIFGNKPNKSKLHS